MNPSEKPTSLSQPDSERIATAYHEAGHAVMAISVGREIQKITISPANLQTGGIRLGACQMKKGRRKSTKDWLEDDVLVLLAGMVAESHFTGKFCQRGAGQDLRAARRLIETRAASERQSEKLERRLLDKAQYLLAADNYAIAVKKIANELIANLTISGRAAHHLFNQSVKSA
jgi:ATP-dependent Zn protease